MRALLDVNVLVALLDPQHVSYVAAHGWLTENLSAGWASCPLTESACLRVLTNPKYSAPASFGVVLAKLNITKSNGNYTFWPDDLSVSDRLVFDWSRLRGHQQVTDVYLLALAVAHGGRLVTFDQRITREAVVGCRSEHLVTL